MHTEKSDGVAIECAVGEMLSVYRLCLADTEIEKAEQISARLLFQRMER